MDVHPTVALLYAQTGLAAKVANEAAAALAAQPETAKRMAVELANQERAQVRETQKGDPSGKTIGDGGGGRGSRFGSRRRGRARSSAPEREEETLPASAGALCGNLLNLKV